MFYMIHNNVKVFHVPTPPIKKMCKGFEGYLCFFIYNVIYNELLFITKFFHICCEFFLWNAFIHLLKEK
jgi:hypothetical protein